MKNNNKSLEKKFKKLNISNIDKVSINPLFKKLFILILLIVILIFYFFIMKKDNKNILVGNYLKKFINKLIKNKYLIKHIYFRNSNLYTLFY